MSCRAVVIGGTGSGVGKTSLAIGLAAALVRRGLRVQTFKVGPDFLDPTYLRLASGRTCYNLDGWMSGREYVRGLFARASADADVAIVEGVMGLFDGASPTGLEGSTAEIAMWLGAPVLLVGNAHGAARSFAAMVKGFAEFEAGVRIAGVIANQSGSARHRAWLSESLAAAKLPPLLGAIPRGALPELPSRHLGLVSADGRVLNAEVIGKLAEAVERHVDLQAVLCASVIPRYSEESTRSNMAARFLGVPRNDDSAGVRIGVARDQAFHFYYPDNLEALQREGAELVEFSPMRDRELPADLDAIYIGGGYPEVHAAELSANAGMIESVQRFAASGRAIYAECGGLMYLGRSVKALDGRCVPMAGIIPIDTEMLPKLKTLGYVEATVGGDSPFWPAGMTLRGHEFHYSQIVKDDSAAEGWQPAYRIKRRRNEAAESEGFAKGKILASYVHLHWAGITGGTPVVRSDVPRASRPCGIQEIA